MSRLDIYRTAMLAASPEVSDSELREVLDRQGSGFARLVIDHGLGPLWHERTGEDEFRESRLQAEALFAMQERAMRDIDAALTGAGIDYAVIKGAANRLLLYSNPANRACYDIDLLVRFEDRVPAATALVNAGFCPFPKAHNISIELLLSRGNIDVDLHWRLLRDGRLRNEDVSGMLTRRRNVQGVWMLDVDDALFLLLVHSAFTKLLATWEMGLHRVADMAIWLQTQSFDWKVVLTRLKENGVRTTAWATLRWIELLSHPHTPSVVQKMLDDLEPGSMRRLWLNRWLRNDLSERTSRFHKVRLLLFSLVLHDNLKGVLGALAGRYRAHRRSKDDLLIIRSLLSE